MTKLSEPQLIRELKTLNLNFTTNRQDIEKYTLSPEMVAAYTMFYLPTNIPKFHFLLDQLPKDVQVDIGKCEFVDIGTGPGTYLLAFLDYFGGEGKVWGVDSSSHMRKQADKTLKTFFPESSFSVGSALPKIEGKKCLFFGNSLNEMGLNAGLEIVDEQEAEFVILIEPGTSEFFREALKLRELMSERGYEILYPCLSGKPCPMKDRKEDWCHQTLRMVHDPTIERLSQLISRDRRSMPFTGHVYRKSKQALEVQKIRLTRFLGSTKFSVDWEGCYFDGEENRIIKIEILKKNHSKKEFKELSNLCPGMSLEFEITKEVNPNQLRVKVTN